MAKSKLDGKRLTLLEAAEQGDHGALLAAVVGRLATALDSADVHARDVAALARQLCEVSRELETRAAADAAQAEYEAALAAVGGDPMAAVVAQLDGFRADV